MDDVQSQEQHRASRRVPSYLARLLPQIDLEYIKKGLAQAGDPYAAYVYGRFKTLRAARMYAASLNPGKVIDSTLAGFIAHGLRAHSASKLGAAILLYKVFSRDSPVIMLIEHVSSRLSNRYKDVIWENVIVYNKLPSNPKAVKTSKYVWYADRVLADMDDVVEWYRWVYSLLSGSNEVARVVEVPFVPVNVVHRGNGLYEVRALVRGKEFVIPVNVRDIAASVEEIRAINRFTNLIRDEFVNNAKRAGLSYEDRLVAADMGDYALLIGPRDGVGHEIGWGDVGKLYSLLVRRTQNGDFVEVYSDYNNSGDIINWFRSRARLHGHGYPDVDLVAGDAVEVEGDTPG